MIHFTLTFRYELKNGNEREMKNKEPREPKWHGGKDALNSTWITLTLYFSFYLNCCCVRGVSVSISCLFDSCRIFSVRYLSVIWLNCCQFIVGMCNNYKHISVVNQSISTFRSAHLSCYASGRAKKKTLCRTLIN